MDEQRKVGHRTIKVAQDAHLEELATKGDIALLRKDMESMRKDMEGVCKDMEHMEDRLFLRLGALMIAVGGVILAYLELRGN